FFNEVTTLHWHMQASHKAEYLNKNNFIFMLPGDTKHHQAEALLSNQPTLDSHLAPRDTVLHYSESEFQEVAIKWLVKTDQPINVLQNPIFMQMINLTSHTDNSVQIPSHKQTHQVIINLFKLNLCELCKQHQVHNHLT
ncbi:hypothetical protein EDD16DRAFT_1499460, partial [Pisolithus croceorrhizus]